MPYNKPVRYGDRLFRGIACLFAAHIVVMMGEEISSFEAFMIPSYYPTLAINYGIALLVAAAVKKVTVILDKKFDWYADIWRRALLQLTFGIAGVSLLSFFLVAIYFLSFGQDIKASGYFYDEFPFSISLITILNLYYVVYYFYVNPRPSKQPIVLNEFFTEEKDRFHSENVVNTLFKSKSRELPAVSNVKQNKENRKTREILIIDTHMRSIPVKVRKIAMFFIYDKTVFVRMNDMKSLSECYQYTVKMADIMQLLDSRQFFRINRQCIINFDVIGAYEVNGKNVLIVPKEEHGKLEGIGDCDWDRIVTVSVDKVADFKAWMNR